MVYLIDILNGRVVGEYADPAAARLRGRLELASFALVEDAKDIQTLLRQEEIKKLLENYTPQHSVVTPETIDDFMFEIGDIDWGNAADVLSSHAIRKTRMHNRALSRHWVSILLHMLMIGKVHRKKFCKALGVQPEAFIKALTALRMGSSAYFTDYYDVRGYNEIYELHGYEIYGDRNRS